MKATTVLIASIFLISGCSTFISIEPETTPIVKSDNTYNPVFENKDNSIYILDFISQKDHAVLCGPEEIYIIDIKTGDLIKKSSTPDSQITSCHISENDTNLFLFTTNSMQAWDTSNAIFKLKISSDNRYLGFEEGSIPGSTLTKVLSLKSNPPN